MVSENNLKLLNSSGRRYIIGTPKSSLHYFEKYLLDKDWLLVHDGVEVKTLTMETKCLFSAKAVIGRRKRNRCTTVSRNGSKRA